MSRSSLLLGFLLCLSLQSVSSEGTELIKHALITRTNISSLASITENVRQMFHSCSKGDVAHAKTWYEEKHYSKYSLKELATFNKFQNVGLTFAFQMYGLSNGQFENNDTTSPAVLHDFITLKLDEANLSTNLQSIEGKQQVCEQASTMALWYVLYMQASYELWGAMEDCRIYGDPNYNNELAGISDPNVFADRFIAFWVGSLNDSLDSTVGYSPFSSTNEVGKYFGTVENGVSTANTNILLGYDNLSALLGKDGCEEDYVDKTMMSMWIVNNRITPYMMVPLIQHLIKALVENDQMNIDVYATLVIPQLSQCRKSNYEYLKEQLMDDEKEFDTMKLHDIMKVLQESYDCLGLTCEDIGKPMGTNDSLLHCNDVDFNPPILAGYYATADVRHNARVDLDLHQMNLLMSFDNDNYWQLAKYIYLYGKNSFEDSHNDDDDSSLDVEFKSLHSLAISDVREDSMFYTSIVEANDGDPYYADLLITDIFDEERYTDESREVKAAIIYNVILTHVMYMNILGEMKDAVDHCHDLSNAKKDNPYRLNTHSTRVWDKVAAYIIGSLEGSDNGGSEEFSDGTFLWSLANIRSVEFDRRNNDGYAMVNAAMKNLLLSGKGQLQHMNCDFMERTSKLIAYYLLIPMVQTVIKYAVTNQFLDWKSGDVEVYEGEIYARFLHPIYHEFDKESAEILKRNMIRNFGILVVDGPQAVADAYIAVGEHTGIDCEYVGKSYEVDACLNYTPGLKEITSKGISIINKWRVRATFASLGLLVTLCV